jgi:hypothetical protein
MLLNDDATMSAAFIAGAGSDDSHPQANSPRMMSGGIRVLRPPGGGPRSERRGGASEGCATRYDAAADVVHTPPGFVDGAASRG